MVSFTVASTDSAIMASIGSPGVRCRSVKTPAVTSSSTGTVAASRRRRSRPISGSGGSAAEPHVLEAHHAVRYGLVARHLRRERLRLDRMHRVDHRQLV